VNPHDFWQAIDPPGTFPADGPFTTGFPATFADGRQLLLPIRPLPDGTHALASLIINQASFAVVEALAADLAAQLAPSKPEIVVGLPTLGLTLASAAARALGHGRYVPLGTSRKFWYEERLSVALRSITTPGQHRRLYIDPRMLPLLAGRRVAVIDDVISSGSSIAAALELLVAADVEPVAIGAAMLQSESWRERLSGPARDWTGRITGVLKSPLLRRLEGSGWVAG
jgi:adenine/guanine phosphoribosyltransferase-like PRPP-binding protein